MRLSFADDLGTVERVAVTIPGVESGGILIEELEQDSSRRTFALKDRQGNVTNYFWQSEKLKSMGDELITKVHIHTSIPPCGYIRHISQQLSIPITPLIMIG
jgi:hypothetical protein